MIIAVVAGVDTGDCAAPTTASPTKIKTPIQNKVFRVIGHQKNCDQWRHVIANGPVRRWGYS
jgi:hypothetical protein